MKTPSFLFAFLFVIVGCAKPVPVDSVTILSPNRKLTLSYRFEITCIEDDDVVSGNKKNSKIPKTPTTREKSFVTGTAWKNAESSLHVKSNPASDFLHVSMMIQKYQIGSTYKEKGQKKQTESSGFDSASSETPSSQEKSYLHLRDAEFVAIVDTQSRIISSDILGAFWAESKPEWKKLQEEIQIRCDPAFVFIALEDSIAYIPPKGTQRNQSWEVQRKKVFSYMPFELLMLTNSPYFIETSTCTLQSVTTKGFHSIATIAIHGKRILHNQGFDPSTGMTNRMKYVDLKGQLKINLNTRSVETLQLECTPIWICPDKEPMKFKTRTMISLKPAG